ncbi:MAG: hypothetical protein HYY06_28385 [Deltaproteobacteria bacterium]|nr:hypothetical protein [Deltaproteobacteria bacterium]
MVAFSDLAEAVVRRAAAVPELDMRAAILREEVLRGPPDEAVELITIICREAEARVPLYLDVLSALHAAIALAPEELRADLAALARARGHDAADRLLRLREGGADSRSGESRVPDYGAGRPLTLGERKSIARRPRRDLIERAIGDPHPDVIRLLLANPRLTETDVVRICARRPCPAEVLRSVARSRWSGRARVRSALVRNPSTPVDVAVPLVSLLLRQELREVAQSSELDPSVRAACAEVLRVKRPAREDDDPTVH